MTPSLIHIPPTSASTSAGDSRDLRTSILYSLSAPAGQKSLPTTILYDERGLELYDDITTHAGEHYYLFPAEEHILKQHAPDVIRVMCADAETDSSSTGSDTRGVLLELGSGSLRKTAHLISALSASASAQTPPSTFAYYALDLAPISLTQSLELLAPMVSESVQLKGLVTDYDSGLKWVREGGLEEPDRAHLDPDRSNPTDHSDVVSRGRLPRQPTQAEDAVDDDDAASVPAEVAVEVPLKAYAGNPAVLPADGERIPNPKYPETPPHSKSRHASRSRSSSPYRSGQSLSGDSCVTGMPSVSLSTRLDSVAPDYTRHSRERYPQAEPLGSTMQWEHSSPPLNLMFLGSSLGNFDRVGSANFLRSLPLRPGSSDTLLLGLDGRNEKRRVERAYNDPEGYTAKFIMNGLNVAAKSLGLDSDVNLIERFEYVGTYNEEIGRHEAYYAAKDAFTIHPSGSDAISFEKGELVNIEYSYKYSDADAHAMFSESNLRPITRWQDPESLYSLWLLERPAFAFPRLIHPGVKADAMQDFKESPAPSPISASFPEDVQSTSDIGVSSVPHAVNDRALDARPQPHGAALGAAFGTPSFEEWKELWKLWDEITLGMISPGMLLEKPIHLRHICLFYLGHIPAFLDIHLSRLLKEPHTDPENFKDIFERGIDPHVDDPTKIHPHSEVPENPEDWPSLESVLGFRDRVRARLARLYEARQRGDEKVVKLARKVDRVLWMCFEHEGWHAETLLYMLIQRAGTPGGTLPPRGFARPIWATLPPPSLSAISSSSSPQRPSDKDLITLPAQNFTIGHDDLESEDPVTHDDSSHEFGWDNEHPLRQVSIPNPILVEKHCVTNAEYLAFFRATNLESSGSEFPASWVRADNGEYEVRSVYGPVPFGVAANWPLVASYDEIAAYAAWKGGRLPNEAELRAFLDQHLGAESSPIGFKEWSFIDALEPQPEKGLRGHNGGVWEWSSSVMDAHEGFVPSAIYPGYSSDFFDNSHNIVLGGSFATIPRIAQRRTVRNYYQHNYRYAWVAGRVVYDVDA